MTNTRIERRKALIREFQQLKAMLGGCKLCGETASCCLEFHHINPKDKVKEVRYFVRACQWKRALAEMAKCILVCSNCHKKLQAQIKADSFNGRTIL